MFDIWVQFTPPLIEDCQYCTDPVLVPKVKLTEVGHWIEPGAPEIVPARLNGLLVIAIAVVEAELFPHKFTALTLIVPEFALALKVIEFVLRPLTIVQPIG